MALINLTLIRELKLEASIHKAMVLSSCYNVVGKKDKVDDAIFVVMIKTHQQAKNLYRQLKALYKLCWDLSQENQQTCLDACQDSPNNTISQSDNIFDVLRHCFRSGTVEDLPPQIEQYEELFRLSRVLAESRKARRQGLNRFLGSQPQYYPATNDAGDSVLMPAAGLPADVIDQLDLPQQLIDIEVEYCLDGYNAFYEKVTQLLATHAGGDVQPCASAILHLFTIHR
jgi:hypothetical protein